MKILKFFMIIFLIFLCCLSGVFIGKKLNTNNCNVKEDFDSDNIYYDLDIENGFGLYSYEIKLYSLPDYITIEITDSAGCLINIDTITNIGKGPVKPDGSYYIGWIAPTGKDINLILNTYYNVIFKAYFGDKIITSDVKGFTYTNPFEIIVNEISVGTLEPTPNL